MEFSTCDLGQTNSVDPDHIAAEKQSNSDLHFFQNPQPSVPVDYTLMITDFDL